MASSLISETLEFETQTDILTLLENVRCQGSNHSGLRQALLALATICSSNSEGQDYFRLAGGVEELKTTLIEGTCPLDVVPATMFCLACAVKQNVTSQNVVLDEHLLTVIHELLSHKDSSPKLMQAASFLLICVVAGSGKGQVLAEETDCLQDLICCLRKCMSENCVDENNWSVLVRAIGVCVNNPQNDHNQQVCCNVLPLMLKFISTQATHQSLHQVLTLIGLIVAGNVSNQDRLCNCGGIETLIELIKEQASVNSLPFPYNIVACAVSALDACIAENEKSVRQAGQLGLVSLLLDILEDKGFDSSQIQILILALAHVLEFAVFTWGYEMCNAEEHHQAVTSGRGYYLLVNILTETQDDELFKAIKYILTLCRTEDNGIVTTPFYDEDKNLSAKDEAIVTRDLKQSTRSVLETEEHVRQLSESLNTLMNQLNSIENKRETVNWLQKVGNMTQSDGNCGLYRPVESTAVDGDDLYFGPQSHSSELQLADPSGEWRKFLVKDSKHKKERMYHSPASFLLPKTQVLRTTSGNCSSVRQHDEWSGNSHLTDNIDPDIRVRSIHNYDKQSSSLQNKRNDLQLKNVRSCKPQCWGQHPAGIDASRSKEQCFFLECQATDTLRVPQGNFNSTPIPKAHTWNRRMECGCWSNSQNLCQQNNRKISELDTTDICCSKENRYESGCETSKSDIQSKSVSCSDNADCHETSYEQSGKHTGVNIMSTNYYHNDRYDHPVELILGHQCMQCSSVHNNTTSNSHEHGPQEKSLKKSCHLKQNLVQNTLPNNSFDKRCGDTSQDTRLSAANKFTDNFPSKTSWSCDFKTSGNIASSSHTSKIPQATNVESVMNLPPLQESPHNLYEGFQKILFSFFTSFMSEKNKESLPFVENHPMNSVVPETKSYSSTFPENRLHRNDLLLNASGHNADSSDVTKIDKHTSDNTENSSVVVGKTETLLNSVASEIHSNVTLLSVCEDDSQQMAQDEDKQKEAQTHIWQFPSCGAYSDLALIDCDKSSLTKEKKTYKTVSENEELGHLQQTSAWLELTKHQHDNVQDNDTFDKTDLDKGMQTFGETEQEVVFTKPKQPAPAGMQKTKHLSIYRPTPNIRHASARLRQSVVSKMRLNEEECSTSQPLSSPALSEFDASLKKLAENHSTSFTHHGSAFSQSTTKGKRLTDSFTASKETTVNLVTYKEKEKQCLVRSKESALQKHIAFESTIPLQRLNATHIHTPFTEFVKSKVHNKDPAFDVDTCRLKSLVKTAETSFTTHACLLFNDAPKYSRKSLCPGCGFGLALNSWTYNIALETSVHACSYHRLVRQCERECIKKYSVKLQPIHKGYAHCKPTKDICITPLRCHVRDVYTFQSDIEHSALPPAKSLKAATERIVKEKVDNESHRPRIPYSQQELFNLLEGVAKIGKHWQQILCTYEFHPSRTAVDLKEKYKRLMGSQNNNSCNDSEQPFSMCEIRRLKRGVKAYGYNWRAILTSYKFLPGRTTANLRNKWKSLNKAL